MHACRSLGVRRTRWYVSRRVYCSTWCGDIVDVRCWCVLLVCCGVATQVYLICCSKDKGVQVGADASCPLPCQDAIPGRGGDGWCTGL